MRREPIPASAEPGNRCAPRRRRAAGFTLIEAALTTVIVGTGVLAIVAAQQAYHQKNAWSQRTGTAMLLANEIREMTWSMPLTDPQGGEVRGAEESSVSLFDDLLDFAGTIDGAGFGSGVTFGANGDYPGPINAMRGVIPEMSRWSQHIRIASVQPDNIGADFGDTIGLVSDPEMLRVTVTVSYQEPQADQPEPVTTLTWVVPKR